MRAQLTKNAVIVPGGRQGRLLPQARRRPTATSCEAEVERQYVAYIRALLDAHRQPRRRRGRPPRRRARARRATTPTSSSPPTRARRRSRTPPTASREEYGFWLGDAFASGGSAGYDHKALGITARGAWESVKRHFRELGRRPRRPTRSPSSASATCRGDVFGNGMLLSRPDPARRRLRPPARLHRPATRTRPPAFAERKRLFELAGSSWDDYDRELISEGGGVWPRTREVDPAVAAGARGARASRTSALRADRGDPRDPARAGRPAVERRHRHGRQGVDGDRRRRARTARATRSASTPTSCAPRRGGGRQPRLHAPRAGRVRRAAAGASTPTSSTTRPASTAPTTRST